jgi:Raf kinase inhibitor-like YbhB/YbcL family protein
MRIARTSLLAISLMMFAGAGAYAAQQQAAPPPPSKFKLTTGAYADGDWIPAQYACGTPDGTSPAVQWSDPPSGTASFAIIFHDTDAAPGKGVQDVTHWILWNIPATAVQLAAGMQPDTSPDGIAQGKNIRGVNGYQPPCPPAGARPHHYIFELYALDTKLELPAGSSRADLLKSMDGHVIGKATVVGIFGRSVDENAWPWEIKKQP